MTTKVSNYNERLRPYLTTKARQLLDTPLCNTVHQYVNEDNNLCSVLACFIQVVVERPLHFMYNNPTTDVISDEDFRKFGGIVSVLADNGVIGFGSLGGVIGLELTQMTATKRWLLAFYSYSHKTVKELQAISSAFTHEGELGRDINVVFNEMVKKFDMTRWTEPFPSYIYIEGRPMAVDNKMRM